MNLSNQILKNNSAIFSVTVSIFVFFVALIPAQAGKLEDTAQQTTVQINSEGNNSPGGSGVIIDKKGKIYTVLTANHVVCDAIKGRKKITCTTDVSYTIRTYTGKDYPIKDRRALQQNENDPDLAVVTFEAQENYPVATLGNSQEVEREADIKVTGFPTIFGKGGTEREYSVTRGKVTTLLRKEKNGYTLVYDATTKTGNSGGPVFDISGRVIGIHGQGDYGGEDGSDPSELQTTRIQKPVIPVKKPVPGKKETGTSPEGKTGFNGAIPINTYFALIGEKPPTPNPSRGVIPPKTEQEPIATIGNTGNFPASMDKLAKLLSQGDWKGADEETKSLILEISQASGSLNDKAISRLSCGNLSAINQIWQTQSQGRFGFSAQAQKWKSLFGNKFEPTNEHFEDFATDLGWRYRGRYLSKDQLKYSLDSPKGYLPRAFLDGPVWGNFIAYFDGCKIK